MTVKERNCWERGAGEEGWGGVEREATMSVEMKKNPNHLHER